MNIDQSIFKAYDIRGIVPDQINSQIAEQIGRAYAKWIQERIENREERRELKVVVGRDVRTHSPEIATALIKGLTSQSIDVIDVGAISTPMLYFIVGSSGAQGGLCVTASHNDKEYNGLKLVREQAIPISGDSGILEIGQLSTQEIPSQPNIGKVTQEDFSDRYLAHLQTLVDFNSFTQKKIVINPNFGANSVILDKLAKLVPAEFVRLNASPDGTFPKGKPDPMLESNRQETQELVKSSSADFGVSFDADGDRVFFFDEGGQFVSAYFVTAILSEALLLLDPGSKIIYDPRSVWAIIETVEQNGGQALINKAGHSFFKERMRSENAIFAGENSGHYYFRDNFFADDGLLAFLTMWQLLSKKNCRFSELFQEIQEKYKISGEINFIVQSSEQVISSLKEKYQEGKQHEIDGLSVEFPDWRFNIRPSNTEPLIRLNAESRSQEVLDKNLPKLIAEIENLGGKIK